MSDRMDQPVGPRPGSQRRPSTRRLARDGALAGAVALAVLLLGATASGQAGFLEAVANGVTLYVPIPVFDAVLSALGPLAKGLVYATVALTVPLAGALVAVLFRSALADRPGIGATAMLAVIGVAAAELLILPLAGVGLLGAGWRGDPAALHVPIILAAVAYAGVLVLLRRTDPDARAGTAPPPAEPADLEHTEVGGGLARREVLRRGVLGIAALSVVGAGLAVLGRIGEAALRPVGGRVARPSIEGYGPTPRTTPVGEFYTVGKDLVPPSVDGTTWRLDVGGLVERPASFDLAELRAFPRVEGYRTMQCISNEVVTWGGLIGNQRWAGLRLADLLDRVGVRPEARWVLWRAADGFTESLPLEVARDEWTWLVDEMGPPGTALTPEHGYPLRVLIAGRYGMKQPKHLVGIELSETDEPGYWVKRGWDETAAVRVWSRIDDPRDADVVPAGVPLDVVGVASSGDRGIGRVDVSLDEGATWAEAELEPPSVDTNERTWRRWRATVTIPEPGRLTVVARAVDLAGNTQDPVVRPPLPSGATGLARISVVAARES
jgi:DMSO/TMAO reductase YedYZ molybdopterin-dependent catalytic subunit